MYPQTPRSASRLLVVDRTAGEFKHRVFSDIMEYLHQGDLLVLNDSKVYPARLIGLKVGTGAKVEVFLLRELDDGRWEALVKPGRRVKRGNEVSLADGRLTARIGERTRSVGRIVEFSADGDLMETIWKHGQVPLPPYINRAPEERDKESYQTVYARVVGAVAAPTAGFHFTNELLENIRAKGVSMTYLTLHPGLGTFRPIAALDASMHEMAEEFYSIPQEAADEINLAKQQGRRVIAVGTTTVRALESSFDEATGRVVPTGGKYTNKFIYPPYGFKVTDCLVTNFHLPRSTLLLLVSAFTGRERVLAAYAEAIRLGYRFYSYGDAMLIV